ncbi:MAG: long-chain fatty acid--CoA ligase [Weeksellaceae bacterium]|nr:long-chain fatty acid--CoA ligase [Weeksellaceae bacterium]
MKITRLFDFLTEQLETHPLPDALVTKKNGVWEKTSTAEFQDLANQCSRGLLKMGVKPGDNVALITTMSRTEWNIVDIGLQQIGAVSVPVYPTISINDYEYIFNQAEVKFVFLSDEDLYKKIEAAKSQISSLQGVFTFDEVRGAANWKEVLSMGEDSATQHEVDHLKNLIKEDDLVTIIYTSGTTGKPKGVMLTHKNIVSNVIASRERVPDFGQNARALSFLPICHVFERMLIYLYQYSNVAIYYAESIETIGDNLKEIKPQVMTVVPRLVEKVYSKIYDKGSTAGGVKTKLFMWALKLVEDYEPYENKGFGWRMQYKIASAIVFKKWREGVGGNLVCMVSGSAKLSERLNKMFWAAGIPILEGYGLTETSPVISVNAMGKENMKVGSVGRPLSNVNVRLAEDGEIQVNGPNVFQGYYKQDELTKEVFTEDGWFMTGDIGHMSKGLLFITDRKKQMFKTSGGKYVAPQILENAMKAIPFIEQIMVVGEGEKMPTAIIQPNFAYIREWANRNNVDVGADNAAIAANETVRKEIHKGIADINQQFGNWEQIKRFELTPEEWTIEDGLLTPTLKHKRRNIQSKYKALYNKLYDRSER